MFGKASRCCLRLSIHFLLSHTTAEEPQFTLGPGRIIDRTLSIKMSLDCLTWAASLACGPWLLLKLLGVPVEVASFGWLSQLWIMTSHLVVLFTLAISMRITSFYLNSLAKFSTVCASMDSLLKFIGSSIKISQCL